MKNYLPIVLASLLLTGCTEDLFIAEHNALPTPALERIAGAVAASPTPGRANMGIIGGQSNCASAGSPESPPSPSPVVFVDSVVAVDALIPYTFRTPRVWRTFAPLGANWGPDLIVARSFYMATGIPPFIYKFCWGSTSAACDWNPVPCGKDIYTKWLIEFKIRVDLLIEMGYDVRVLAIFWTQGESDAFPSSAPNYGVNAFALLDQMRADMGAYIGQDLSKMLVVTSHIFEGGEWAEEVNAQKDVLCDAHEEFLCVPTRDLERVANSPWHWNPDGIRRIGARYYTAWQTYEIQAQKLSSEIKHIKLYRRH